jgi:hypothetical protein
MTVISILSILYFVLYNCCLYPQFLLGRFDQHITAGCIQIDADFRKCLVMVGQYWHQLPTPWTLSKHNSLIFALNTSSATLTAAIMTHNLA